MARDDLALYLTLSPEFGGTRFGPFEGLEIRLGADRERCHIVLPEAFGVAREHCKVIRQGDGLILAASERTAAVFVWKGDARRPTQIQAPTSIRPGDSFALVSPEGARFAVVLAALPAEMVAAREKKKRGRNNLTADKFAKEGWRMLMARIWSMGPFGLAMRGWYMVTSGALLQPRILIPLMIAAFGYIGAAGSSCAAIKFKSDQKKAQSDLEQCNDRASVGGGASGINASIPDLIVAVDSGDKSLAVILDKDGALKGAITKSIREILENPDQYEWMLRGEGDAAEDWVKLRAQIDESDKFDALTKLVLPYASALPKRTSEQWNVLTDVTGQQVCVRGPARLTYRQAVSLGLESVQLDGYHGATTMGFTSDDAGRIQLLQASASASGVTFPDPPPAVEESQLASGTEFCTFASGSDDRESLSKVVRAFEKQFGEKALFVTDTADVKAAVTRLVKLFAADIPGNAYTADAPPFNFENGYVSPLKDHPTQAKIIERTAEAIARSVALPCIAALKSNDIVESTFGRRVDPVTCLVLDWKLRQAPE